MQSNSSTLTIGFFWMRCTLRMTALCALAILAACSPKVPPETSSRASGNWTQFRMNPQHNPVLPGTIRASWKVHARGGFSSSPAVAGDYAYIGDNAGWLYAIDVRTGRVRWRRHFSAPLMSNPLLWNGIVIVGEGEESVAGTDHDRRLVVGLTANALIAVDAATGAQRWLVPLAGSGMPTPAIVRGLIVHHNGSGFIAAFVPETGEVRYTVDTGSDAAMSAATPSGSGRFITAGGIAGYGNRLEERAATDGARIWSLQFPRWYFGISDCPPAIGDGIIHCNYVAPAPGTHAPYKAGMLVTQHAYGVDATTGKRLWDHALETGTRPLRNLAAIPLVVGHTVYFGSSIAPYVHALDTRTGRLRWRARVRGTVKSGIAEKSGILYFGDLAGYLWAVDAPTGRIIGAKNMHTSFNVGSPVIVGNTLVSGTNKGTVIAIPLDVIRDSNDR